MIRPVNRASGRVFQVYGKRNGKKVYLGTFPDRRSAVAADEDHRVPRSRGGNDHIDNLQIAHRRCNQSRGVEPWSGGPEAP